MNTIRTENKKESELFQFLDRTLSDLVDKNLLQDLDYWLDLVGQKSRALASSLKRCFNNARNSKRYVLVYKLGEKDEANKIPIKEEELETYLGDYLKNYFEKNDFMHYREFVRLLRACTIDVGGKVSSNIKEIYNDFFFKERLIAAYKLGRSQSPETCSKKL